jgi:hypothetical protein
MDDAIAWTYLELQGNNMTAKLGAHMGATSKYIKSQDR